MNRFIFTPKKTTFILSTLLFSGISFAEEETKNKVNHLGELIINDNESRQKEGYNQVYDKNISNIFIGKEAIERYKGTSAADILRDAIGVFSGDSRNGNALDVNIRGIQGPGRVPVTIDGTEQAITVYRGYQGANNRNYLDPNLISEIQIEKGPSLTRNMRSSVGGTVAMKTLSFDDIVKKGDKFGINIALEGSSNSVKPEIPNPRLGEDYRFIPEPLYHRFRIEDSRYHIKPHNRYKIPFYSGNDHAYRIALGLKGEQSNFIFAYAYRQRGNYLAGAHGAKNYSQQINQEKMGHVGPGSTHDPYMPFVANIYRPNNEVPNTSADLKSWLVKYTWLFSDNAALQFSWRDTQSEFGDIMPSRLGWFRAEDNIIPQWELANVHISTGYLRYKWQPEELAYIDLDVNLWTTLANTRTNSAGGFPRFPKQNDPSYDYSGGERINLAIDGTFINTAAINNQNQRYGLDISNLFKLTPTLDMTLSANMQYQKLKGHNDYPNSETYPYSGRGRQGQRLEYNHTINFNWQPTHWLDLSAGVKQTIYWTIDDLLKECVSNKYRWCKDTHQKIAYQYIVHRAFNKEEVEILERYQEYHALGWKIKKTKDPLEKQRLQEKSDRQENGWAIAGLRYTLGDDMRMRMRYYDKEGKPYLAGPKENVIQSYEIEHSHYIYINPANGKLRHEDRQTKDVDYSQRGIDPFINKEVVIHRYDRYSSGINATISRTSATQWKTEPRRQASDWSPVLSAAANLTDNTRVYIRYAQAMRMPSLFENTVGFSGSVNFKHIGETFKPETTKTKEYGFIYNAQQLLNAKHHADIKIAYYDTQMENVFERVFYRFTQVDKLLLSGLELQARYDTGFLFADIGLNYNIKNKVCDSTSIVLLDVHNYYRLSNCINGGFPGGFLRTQIPPQYSANMKLGIRLFNESLEIGSRWLYHHSVINKEELRFMQIFPNEYRGANNTPMRWNAALTLDAYIKYTFNENMAVELTGTNIINEYYLDPLTRSMIPAPGRTIKLRLSARF